MPQRSTIVLVLWTILLVNTAPAVSGEWWGIHFAQKGHTVTCPQKFCCDDYHRKCIPFARKVDCFLCDDYCRKPLPCVVPVDCFLCDDYCRKPVPIPTCPPCANFMCVPDAPHLPPAKIAD